MGLRNLNQLTHELFREINVPINRADLFQVREALNDAYLEVFQYCNWSFTLARFDIPFFQSYTTGTVSVAFGSTTVTGVGTTWSTAWTNKKIVITGDPNDLVISAVTSPTTLTLAFPFNDNTSGITNATYTIYQESYPVPCTSGRDLMVLNPQFWGWRIEKLDQYTFHDQTNVVRTMSGVRPWWYCEDGTDTVTVAPQSRLKLKFWPRPLSAQSVVLWYYQSFAPLLNDTDQTLLPPEFDDILIKLALYRLKKRYGVVGWTEDKTHAMRMLVQFKNKHNIEASSDYRPRKGVLPFNDSWSIDNALGSWPGNVSI